MSYPVRVISPHEASYKIPLTAAAGEELALGQTDPEWPGWIWATDARGQGGWIPESYLQIWGATGHVVRDYTGRELSVQPGDVLTVEDEESGWLWATNIRGESGWVPEKNTQRVA